MNQQDESQPAAFTIPGLSLSGGWSGYAWALTIVAFCTGLAKLMLPYFAPANVVMVYLLGVVIVSVRHGRGPSIVSSVLSVAAFDFFFVPPTLTFAVSDTQYIVTFAVMLTVALVISTLTVRTKEQSEIARLNEWRTNALYAMSRDLASTDDVAGLVDTGLRHIAAVFDSRVALCRLDDSGQLVGHRASDARYALVDIDEGVALWSFNNKHRAGLSTDNLPGTNALYIPLLGSQKTIGVLAIRPAHTTRFASTDQLRLLETFGNQIATACERALLATENERSRLQVESEQLKNTLLSSVSHDLKTPLATITGAASSIVEGTEELDVGSCREMAREICDEAVRLNRLVSNLLDMTRVQSGTLTVRRESHPVDEIIGAALNRLDDGLAGRSVKTCVPSDLPMIPVDAILIQQVLVNLLENAIKYTPSGSEIDVRVTTADGLATFEVGDRGPGIAPENRHLIFQKFFRGNAAAGRGVGLGLAICSGIVEAHGGKIWVDNRTGGGAAFRFTLPIPGECPKVDGTD